MEFWHWCSKQIISPRKFKLEVLFFALILEAGFVGLLALAAFIGNMVGFAVFYKICSGFHKAKSDIGSHTFIKKLFHPLIAKRPGAIIIFAAGHHLLDNAFLQIRSTSSDSAIKYPSSPSMTASLLSGSTTMLSLQL